jgi:GMP synthase-like glutamine amidotransferase
MKVQVFQHVPFEDIGSMARWFAARGIVPGYTRFFDDPGLPSLDGLDLLVVMGGPMSVNDEARCPWLAAEKAFIRQAMERGVGVLGICLGAQLIASAAGARVYPNRAKEIGWFPIQGSGPSQAVPQEAPRLPPEIRVFHWHGETFDLPPGAHRLASSAACENQAFAIGQHVVGLQFHLETTPESAAALLEHCRDELVEGTWIQTEEQIRGVDAATYQVANHLMEQVLEHLARPRARH